METKAYSVLVVEDNEYVLRCMRDTLDWTSYHMIAPELFRSAEEAMIRIETHKYDVAIVDIKLIGMSGLDLVAWMREHNPEAEVMIISAYREFEFAQKCVALGVRQYLLKPFSSVELREALKNLRKICDSNRSYREQFMRSIHTHIVACDKEKLTDTLLRFREALDKNAMFYALVDTPNDACDDVKKIAEALIVKQCMKDTVSVKDIVIKVVRLIETDYAQELSLCSTAKRFGVSSTYLSTIFKRETGETFTDALIRIRMQHADELIKLGVTPGNAAQQTGYNSYKSFYKTYKKFFDTAPTVMKSNKNAISN